MKPYINIIFFFTIFFFSCSSYNKGVTNKKDFRSSNPPSVKIQKEYIKEAKKAKRKQKDLTGKEGEDLTKAQDKLKRKKLKRDKRYLKKRRKKLKK